MGVRRVLRAAVLASFLAAGLVPAGASAAETSDLLGIARDSVGQAVAGVRVIVLHDRATGGAVAEAFTGSDGRYRIPGLAPGIYRIAAIKAGYRTFLGQVHTLFRDSLDLVLEPLPTDPALTPEDLGWVLRLPPRSILREIEAALPDDLEASRGGTAALRAAATDVLQGRVEHLVSLPASAGGSGEGSETRVSLGGRMGERTSLSLDGSRAERRWEDRDGPALEDVALALAWDTSLDSRLDVRALYAARRSSEADARTTRGLDARWSSQIDGVSRVDVDLAYLDGGHGDGWTAGDSDRAMAASGTYATLLGATHDVRIDLRAEGRDGGLLPGLPGGRPAWVATGDAEVSTWNVRLDAGDAWQAAGPWSVVYGVGYRRDLRTGGDEGILVGRAGAAWTDGSARAALILSVSETRPGYRARVEVPVGAGLRFTAERLDEPVHDAGPSALDGMLPVLSDGAPALRRSRIGLEQERGAARVRVDVAQGEAAGRLAPLLPLDLPLVLLAEGTLAYTSGALGVRVIPSGTDVSAEYVRFEGAGTEPAGEWVELRLAQEILRTDGAGARWRLLLAARTVSGVEEVAETAPRDAIDPWIRAGVSLAF